jgi:hypothetical protein
MNDNQMPSYQKNNTFSALCKSCNRWFQAAWRAKLDFFVLKVPVVYVILATLTVYGLLSFSYPALLSGYVWWAMAAAAALLCYGIAIDFLTRLSLYRLERIGLDQSDYMEIYQLLWSNPLFSISPRAPMESIPLLLSKFNGF